MFLDPAAELYEPARRAIVEADIIVICPGDLYSSLVPTLLTKGMKEAIQKSKARTVWVCNTMTKWGETNDFTASDFARELTRYSGIHIFDYIIWNTKSIAEEVREQYARERKYPVQLDEDELQEYATEIKKADLLSRTDLVRFDSQKVARILAEL